MWLACYQSLLYRVKSVQIRNVDGFYQKKLRIWTLFTQCSADVWQALVFVSSQRLHLNLSRYLKKFQFHFHFRNTTSTLCGWLLPYFTTFYMNLLSSQHLPVQSQEQKQQKNMYNMTIKTQERHHGRHFSAFIVNFEHISQLFLVFTMLILNK